MRPFKYSNPKDVNTAIKLAGTNQQAKYLAGGTNILDLMKEDVEKPNELIDITELKPDSITPINAGGISLGALAKNSTTANHTLVRQNYPLLSQAILAGASAQIRNMATNGGNINQRTRCPYFYEVSMPCNKREPGTGCGAKEGINRLHAIFGWSDKCVAVNPSDMSVALVALDATVKIKGPNGTQRTIPFADYHVLPGDHPELDSNLKAGELVTSIDLPKNNFAGHSYYLKVRDRASYAFALVSVAAAFELSGGIISQARIALGGVAHKPWRTTAAETFLRGKPATEENFKQAAELAMQDAKPLEHNAYKIQLAKLAIARALMQALHGATPEAS
jgi:xanthine dehydrogenase YagS FAD-binding subunit